MKYEIFAFEGGREVRMGQTATKSESEALAKQLRKTHDKVRINKINLGIKNARRYF